MLINVFVLWVIYVGLMMLNNKYLINMYINILFIILYFFKGRYWNFDREFRIISWIKRF